MVDDNYKAGITPFVKLLLEIGGPELKKVYLQKGKIPAKLAIEAAKHFDLDPELIAGVERKAIDDGSLSILYKGDVLEQKILKAPEVQEFRCHIQPILNATDNERAIENIATLLYKRLSDEDKQALTEKTVRMYILHLGFIRLPRASHRHACDFIIKYQPLFRGIPDVLDNIVERYVEEELAATPIELTNKRVTELKKEVRSMYKGVKQ